TPDKIVGRNVVFSRYQHTVPGVAGDYISEPDIANLIVRGIDDPDSVTAIPQARVAVAVGSDEVSFDHAIERCIVRSDSMADEHPVPKNVDNAQLHDRSPDASRVDLQTVRLFAGRVSIGPRKHDHLATKSTRSAAIDCHSLSDRWEASLGNGNFLLSHTDLKL